jgi:hypothetical protein
MGSLMSTTIVVVGDAAPDTLGALRHYANVSAALFTDDTDTEVRRWVSGVHSPYLAHNRDPLAHVAAAWVEFFDDQTTLGTLDLEVDRALAAFKRQDLEMPDYYVVTDPEKLSTTWQHWWLGVLPQAAPTRVIPWGEAATGSLGRTLRSLPTSRPWPDTDRWLHEVARTIPARLVTGPGDTAHTESADDE